MKTCRTTLAFLACLSALGDLSLGQEAIPVWKMAKPRPSAPGAPKYSDVTLRNLRPHPSEVDKTPDPHDSLRIIQDFHATRLEWTYGLTRAFTEKLRAQGITTVGGAIEDDSGSSSKQGRVVDDAGQFATHAWFHKGRLVGCANAPEFREAWLKEARRSLDAGVDIMQQDDPQMAVRCSPPLCHCKYCREAFIEYQEKHGAAADYEKFQEASILAFHRAMHRQLDATARRHVPFSHNNLIGFQGALDFTAPAFDFVNCEIDGKNVLPVNFYRKVETAGALPMVFSYREGSKDMNRRFLALTYATGTWMLMPWDVFMGPTAPRYFGKAEDYADLSGFVRGNAGFLDGYESAAAVGPGIKDKRYAALAAPLTLEGGSGETYAFVRARPGQADAPVAVHLEDWSPTPQPFKIQLRNACFPGALTLSLRVPAPYNAEAHRKAQETGKFGDLVIETSLSVEKLGEWSSVTVPALSPWGILVVSFR